MKEFFKDELSALSLEEKKILANNIPSFSAQIEKVLGCTGKSIRPRVMLSFAGAGGALPEGTRFYAACLELLHLGSLIQDDVLDEADLRRGQPAVHKILGRKNAVLTGDFLCMRVFREIERRGNYPVLREFLTYSSELVEGEIAQCLAAADTLLPEEDYLRFVEKKTGSLFTIAAAVGSRLAGLSEENVVRARRFGALFGTAFQIVDDVTDLTGRSESSGKTPFSDVKNGVMTLPILHFIRTGGDFSRLKAFCAEGLWNEAVDMLNTRNSLDYAVAGAERAVTAAMAEIRECFPADTVKQADALAAGLLSRIKEGVLYGI